MLRAALEQTAAHGPRVAVDPAYPVAPEGSPWPARTAATLNASFGEKQGLEDQHALGCASWFIPVSERENLIAFHGSQDPDASGPVTHPIPAQNNGMATCFEVGVRGDKAHTLTAEGFDASEDGTGRGNPVVAYPAAPAPACGAYAVRRLTPTECHRLQGFPDDHCAIDRVGKPAADGVQYKALGNSMAVPVINWIIARASGLPPAIKGAT